MSSIRLFTDGQLDTAREVAVLPYLSHIPNLEDKIRHIAKNKDIDYCVTCGRPGVSVALHAARSCRKMGKVRRADLFRNERRQRYPILIHSDSF